MAAGVGDSPDRVRRIFPFWLMNCRSILGVSAGPSPEARLVICSAQERLERRTFGFRWKNDDMIKCPLSMSKQGKVFIFGGLKGELVASHYRVSCLACTSCD